MRGRDAELELDAPHALEGALGHHPLRGEQVADDAQRGEQHRGVEQHGPEDQRLDVAVAAAVDVGDDEADPHRHRGQAEQRRRAQNTRSGSYWA